MLRLVIDTNIWLRVLRGGPVTMPVLIAWRHGLFLAVVSEELLAELTEVVSRPRNQRRITVAEAEELFTQLSNRAVFVDLKTVPPNCRDPKDAPVLATAIAGHVDAIVTGDADLRADDDLRQAMADYGVELWGIETFLSRLAQSQS